MASIIEIVKVFFKDLVLRCTKRILQLQQLLKALWKCVSNLE